MSNVAALYCPPTKWEPEPWFEPGDGAGDLHIDRNTAAVRQAASWTCSCASMAWVMNSLGVPSPDGGLWDEWHAVNELRRIAGASAVSPAYGLAYGSGVDLEAVYREYGFTVERMVDVSWAQLAYLCESSIGQIGGARLYHWVGLRGYDGMTFTLANPAPGWKSVGDELTASEWGTWGSWTAVMVTGVQ